jgi:hypothetical protein
VRGAKYVAGSTPLRCPPEKSSMGSHVSGDVKLREFRLTLIGCSGGGENPGRGALKSAFVKLSASSARESIPWMKISTFEFGAMDGGDSGFKTHRESSDGLTGTTVSSTGVVASAPPQTFRPSVNVPEIK